MKSTLVLLLAGLAAFLMLAFGPAAEPKTQIFLVGDSTMADKADLTKPERGWGMEFGQFFDGSVVIRNTAMNGRSTKSFLREGRWAKVLEGLKPGDWVFIQFGHNDEKVEDSTRSAPAQTLYRQLLTKFVQEAKQKGANPVLLTPVGRRFFDEAGKRKDDHGEYPGVVREVAKAQKVPLIDLHEKSWAMYSQLGEQGSRPLFWSYLNGYYQPNPVPPAKNDNTHFSEYGATRVAQLVAQSVKEQNLALASHLSRAPFDGKYLFDLPVVLEPMFKKDTFNIAKYGAVADGQTLNTEAFRKAVDACAVNGGTVLVPRGLWLTGPIVLKNNVNLHLATGALVQFTADRSQYPLIKTTWEGEEAIRSQAPISGVDLTNIAITGNGIFDGAGDAWRPVKKNKLNETQWQKLVASGGVLSDKKDYWYPSAGSMKGNLLATAGTPRKSLDPKDFDDIRDFLRPNMLSLTRCKQILLEGFTIQNSPAWTIHPLLCENITLRNVTAKNPWYGQNTDALDLESCRTGVVEGCTFDVGDDGICIKSGRDEQGRKRGVPTENFIVRDTKVYHAHGGFVIGSEMSGGARNLYVYNCTFMGTDVGLRFKTARGRGGVVENIFVDGVDMTDIAGEAILFDMYYAAKDPVPLAGESTAPPVIAAQPLNEGTPQFKGFRIRNVTCKGATTGILVRGLPEMSIKDISIENAVLESKKGLVCQEAENIRLKNVTLLSTETAPVMEVQNSHNIALDGIHYTKGAELLMRVTGDRSKDIRLTNTNTKLAKKDVELGQKVAKKAVVFAKR
ncbi:glycosyl hydrolase family 28 protein [Hymenobacter sp. BT770]|uniref:glycosyl hydrolase family 28 protein n=1 Tax=Hymenobacter sp. BT770 TaxID=2886942 RepID=UPI001D11773D|nr:glycosyl hydrolase family 28 protein [Hymenobacter sp. BT770]MCC3154810.1 GDSL-type esterase/lipase family protein [Hymenobacter sp. BT770]MDO3416815.1 glycosyl hydrolase family 28 protein [Hymenobacter sp. BT770]